MVFQPGQSGNPNDRKPGARNKRTEAIFQMLEERPVVAQSHLCESRPCRMAQSFKTRGVSRVPVIVRSRSPELKVN
jgi:hypothetical protein